MATRLDGIKLEADTRPVRRVGPEEAAALLERHLALGTCPSCHAKVERFCAYQIDDEAEQRFACEHCSPLAASVVRGTEVARLKLRQ